MWVDRHSGCHIDFNKLYSDLSMRGSTLTFPDWLVKSLAPVASSLLQKKRMRATFSDNQFEVRRRNQRICLC
jgi:hypothetical protein